jgi:hypothetical protein
LSEYLNVPLEFLKKASKTTQRLQVEGFRTSELKKQQQRDMMLSEYIPNSFSAGPIALALLIHTITAPFLAF